MCVSSKIRNEPFQPGIFFFHLAQPPQFAHPEVRVLLVPRVKGGVRPPQLPAEITDLGARLRLTQRVDDLLFGKSRLSGETSVSISRGAG